jgi:predicted peptidase
VFHGSGEIGVDNVKQMTRFALVWARDATRRTFPAFVLAPQMPARSALYSGAATEDRRTSEPRPPLHAALALIEDLAAKLPIDPTRIYLVGFSMGASTAWNAIHARPAMFAAAVPIAGVPNPAHAAAVAATPLWLVHGNRDDTNPIRHDRAVYRPLVDAGGRVRFWEIDLLGHEVPSWLLADDELPRWLFTHRRR